MQHFFKKKYKYIYLLSSWTLLISFKNIKHSSGYHRLLLYLCSMLSYLLKIPFILLPAFSQYTVLNAISNQSSNSYLFKIQAYLLSYISLNRQMCNVFFSLSYNFSINVMSHSYYFKYNIFSGIFIHNKGKGVSICISSLCMGHHTK